MRCTHRSALNYAVVFIPHEAIYTTRDRSDIIRNAPYQNTENTPFKLKIITYFVGGLNIFFYLCRNDS